MLAELPDAEIDAALDGHPRIGASADNASSAREQARVADADDDVRADLAEKNREYEDQFGYVYLVCASGRTAEELLAILTDRLDNDPGHRAPGDAQRVGQDQPAAPGTSRQRAGMTATATTPRAWTCRHAFGEFACH